MLLALNAWTLADSLEPIEQLRAAARAGFDGLELCIADDGPLTFDTPPPSFAQLRSAASDLGVRITALATAKFWEVNYASPAPADRTRAAQLTRILLDQAAAAGAGAILVVPAVIGKASEPRGRVRYADALHYAADALSALRFEAESRGVTIALENCWNRFLYSPVEFADLLDRVNSPCVGAYLDIGNLQAFGDPLDWIETLAARIARVHVKDFDASRPGWTGFCPLGEGSVDWPGVIAALRAVGYDGPLTYEGRGDPAEIVRRMRAWPIPPPRAAPENAP